MKRNLFLLGALFFSVVLFTGCEVSDPLSNMVTEEEIREVSPIVEDNTNAQLNAVKVFENVNNYGISEEGIPGKSAFIVDNGPSLLWNNYTLTMDYTNVTGYSGKIIVAFNQNPAYAVGLKATVTFDNYVDNATAIAGEMSLEITEFVLNTKAKFNLKTNNALTFTNGSSSYTWNCDQNITWTEGIATLTDGADDKFVINGTVEQNANNFLNSMSFTDVIYSANCEYLLSGIMELTSHKGDASELKIKCDFSVGANSTTTGECDSWVKLYTDSLSIIINLAD